MEKCNRLRGKKVPNPPGLLHSNVLRLNEVSFSARNGVEEMALIQQPII
jgi:hypothetical protein